MTDAIVTPRPAASLVLVRPGAAGPAVLMGQRGAAHRFMPHRLVFPGGAVDPGDASAPAASEPPAATTAHLLRNAEPGLARALTVAAARELEEETGLSLGTPPALGVLDYLCRAETPPSQPIRFDARFFVADARHATGTLAGSGELEELRWLPVDEVLRLDLARVTREVLGQLRTWLDLSGAERAARAQTPVFIGQKWQME